MKFAFHPLRLVAHRPASILLALAILGPGLDRVSGQNASIDARDDAKAALKDWSRGTTILIDGLREAVKTYRPALAQRLGVADAELAGAMKRDSGKARQQHERVISDYEATAEKEALAAGVDPRSVNPRVRAKFGKLVVRSGGGTELLSDALSRGRTLRDQIFEAAYQAAANGVEPLDDQKVQAALSAYLDHRQRITEAIEDHIENWPASDGTGNPFMWIGFGFLLLLILFLIVAFFAFDTLSSDRRAQLRFLSVLCAGFAGMFLTGSALFNAEWTGAAGKIGVSGAAGCALFMIVFYGYRKFLPDAPNNPGLPDRLSVDIPPHWNFEQAIAALGRVGKAGVELQGFSEKERKAPIHSQALEGKSVADLMLALRGLTIPSGAIRKYGIRKKGSSYTLTVR